MASKQETRLRNKIKKAIEAEFEDVYIFHPHGSMYAAGAPDLCGCLSPEGTFFGLEVKMPRSRNRLTKLQGEYLARINGAGGIAAVVTTVKEALDALSD